MRRCAGLMLAFTACVGEIGQPPGTPLNPPAPPGVPPDPMNPDDDPTTPCIEKGPPITPRLRRLTFAQYDRAVSSLLGTELTPSTQLGPEVDDITPVLWSGIETAAETLARDAIADPAIRARILTCAPAGDGSACATQFITEFGRKVYRRSLEQAELAAYNALYTDRAMLTERGTFEEGVQLILEVMLKSPSFLLRVEKSATIENGRIALTGLEMASRMSFALWNGPPDEALLTAAETGVLDGADGVRDQARRMLSTPEGIERARPLLRAANRDFLGMEGAYGHFWTNTMRDPMLFPEFYPGIDADFREEVVRFMEHVILDRGGSYRDLMTSNLAVVNERIAPIYGLQGGPDWRAVELDAATRPGLLTRAGFTGTHGRYTRGSLIFRGTFVLKRILCQELGSPPPGAESTPLPDATADLKTTRDRIQAMTSPTLCASCHHERINPAGFALETFDGIGRHRTTDNEVAIDTRGSIFLDGESRSFADAASYAELLAASSEAHACFVGRFAQFTFADAEIDLGCEGERLAEAMAKPGAKIADVYAEFVAGDAFRYRSTEEAP